MLNHKVKLAEQITGHHGPTFACKHWFEHLYFRPTWTGSLTHIDPARPPYIQSVWQNTSSIYCLDLSLNVTHLLFPHLGKSFPPSSPTLEKTYLVIAMKTKSFQQKKKKNAQLQKQHSIGKRFLNRERMQSFERMKEKYVCTCRHRYMLHRPVFSWTNKRQQIDLAGDVIPAGPHRRFEESTLDFPKTGTPISHTTHNVFGY